MGMVIKEGKAKEISLAQMNFYYSRREKSK